MGRPPRHAVWDPQQVNYLFICKRCVRGQWLTGIDPESGRDFSYRRHWVMDRIAALASVFAVDVLEYAVLSNHFHLVLRNRPDVIEQWDDRELAIRWLRVFPGRRIEEGLAEPTESDVEKLLADPQRLAVIRERMVDVSWFMRSLCEPIARRANREDECTGHFWQGRYTAQAIVDEAGLLSCSVYTDLNQVRATLAESIEASEHSSIYDRLQAEQGQTIAATALQAAPQSNEQAGETIRTTPPDQQRKNAAQRARSKKSRRIPADRWLAPLTLSDETRSDQPELDSQGLRASNKGFLRLDLQSYLQLLRWTLAGESAGGSGGSAEQPSPKLEAMLERFGLKASHWRELVGNFSRYFGRSSCIGSPKRLAEAARARGKCWIPGQRSAAACFAPG